MVRASSILEPFRFSGCKLISTSAAFTTRRIAPFRVPFKVPFNTVSINSQTTSKSVPPACDKTKPLRDPDDVLEEAPIDLVDESEESLPCGSDSFQPGLKCGHFRLKFSFLASPISLSESDHEMELDVSFSQKIPVGFLPRETVPD